MGTELNVVTSRLHFTVKISLLTCNIKVSSSLLCDNTAIHCTNICPLVSYLHLTDNQKECSSLPVSHDPPLFFILALLHHPTQDGGRPQWIIPPLFHFLPKYSRFRGDTVSWQDRVTWSPTRTTTSSMLMVIGTSPARKRWEQMHWLSPRV